MIVACDMCGVFTVHYSIHGSVSAITVLGVAHESHDTTIVSTPETKEETGEYIVDDIIINDVITIGEPSPLIVVQFDVHPLGISSDFMLFASLNPLEIIYDSVSKHFMCSTHVM